MLDRILTKHLTQSGLQNELRLSFGHLLVSRTL